jgi:small subunit ribosomal protein S1
MKAVLPEPPQEEPTESEQPEPERQAARPKRTTPLKGGMDRDSGGEQFGLKW